MHTRAASPSELMHAVKTRLSHPEAESQNRIAAFVPAEDQRVIPACSQRLLSRKCRATRDDRIIRSDTQSILPASEYSSRKNVHIRPFKAAPCDSQSWHRALFVNRGKKWLFHKTSSSVLLSCSWHQNDKASSNLRQPKLRIDRLRESASTSLPSESTVHPLNEWDPFSSSFSVQFRFNARLPPDLMKSSRGWYMQMYE